MKFECIENKGPDNLRDTLRGQLAGASDASIAAAFVTQPGLDEILQPLRQVAANGSVRLLTGLYQKVTEPRALKTLLRVQTETRGRFSVRLSREPQFHRKLYLLKNPTQSILILGSSNLTREGLRSGGELNLMLPFPKRSPAVRKITQAFEDDWQHRGVPLTVQRIQAYERTRPKRPRRDCYTRGQLAEILGTTASHRQASSDDDQSRGYWRDWISGFAKGRTERIISETTNWDDKNYQWYGPNGPHLYKIGDRIFLFDFADGHVYLVEVRDIARTKVPTPDGRHFVAYKRLLGLTRRISKKLWSSLQGEGIDPEKARRRAKIGPEKAERLRALIRPTRKRKRHPAA